MESLYDAPTNLEALPKWSQEKSISGRTGLQDLLEKLEIKYKHGRL
jgi:hypothetical protein